MDFMPHETLNDESFELIEQKNVNAQLWNIMKWQRITFWISCTEWSAKIHCISWLRPEKWLLKLSSKAKGMILMSEHHMCISIIIYLPHCIWYFRRFLIFIINNLILLPNLSYMALYVSNARIKKLLRTIHIY